jgi:hypothetical protein
MRFVCLLVVSSVLVSANSVLFDLEPNQEKVNNRFPLRNGKAMRAFCLQCFSEDIEQHELFVAGFSTKDAVDFKVRDRIACIPFVTICGLDHRLRWKFALQKDEPPYRKIYPHGAARRNAQILFQALRLLNLFKQCGQSPLYVNMFSFLKLLR